MDGWMDGWMDGYKGGRMDGWIDGPKAVSSLAYSNKKRRNCGIWWVLEISSQFIFTYLKGVSTAENWAKFIDSLLPFKIIITSNN